MLGHRFGPRDRIGSSAPEAVHEDNEQRVDTDRALGRIFRIVGLFPVRVRETLRAGGRSDADGGAGCRFDADGK